jgi:Glycosyltransferase family 10 (fucosyltransferase).
MNGMRTHIYNQLENIAPIDCPSSLLHNIDIELSYRREDKIKLLHNYTFTICPENIISKGYVTEKLADAFMGGAIPIYQGYLNDFDKSIINEKRIIFGMNLARNSLNNFIQILAHIKILLKNQFFFLMQQKKFFNTFKL